MNSLFPGIADIKMSSPTMTLTFDRECILPKLGETMSDGKYYELVVTAVNEKEHSIQAIVNNTISIKDKVLYKRKELFKILTELAFNLHEDVSEGMLGLLSWEQLEREQHDKYTQAVINIIKTLEDKGFIKYGPYDL